MAINGETVPVPASTEGEHDGVTVAAVQFSPGPDAGENLAAIRSLTASAVGHGSRVVVFPEYSSYFDVPLGPGLLAAAEDLDGEFVDALGALARELSIHLIAGMVERSWIPSKVHNTLVAVSPSGEVVASYRKVHLYDAFGVRESDWMAPGSVDSAPVFEVDGLRFGLQTCYDLRFPEVSRWLIDAGAEVLVVPAEWVRGAHKVMHWRTLLAARAIENTAFVIAADHRPPVGVGCSMILDPLGDVLVELGDEEGVAVATLARESLDRVRETNPALRLRRFRVSSS